MYIFSLSTGREAAHAIICIGAVATDFLFGH